MSSQGNGERIFYEVDASKQIRDLIKHRHAEVAKVGRGHEFVKALRYVYERLRAEPLELGEPLYRLPVLKLQIRQAMVGKLVIEYAVYEEKPLVFIRGFKFLD